MPALHVSHLRTPRHNLLPVVAGLLAAVLFVACEALPTDPALENDRSIAGAERFDGGASASALPAGLQVTSGTTSFMCVLSTRTDGASAGAMGPAYTYRYVGLAFDEQLVQAAQGEVMTLTYRLRDERGQITRQATCRVPAATGVDARLVAWLFPERLTSSMRETIRSQTGDGVILMSDLDPWDLVGEPCWDGGIWLIDPFTGNLMCWGAEVIGDPIDDEEEVEPIDGGGGGEPWNPDDDPDFPEDGGGGGGGTPPSDDCPDDNDDTPAPPEGGDDPCDFGCWDPPDDDDDPFNPPGFMSVQSWQTTSSGMAVAVYQPASTDCPGDGDDDEVTCEIDLQDLESLYSEAAEGVLEALIEAIEQFGNDYGLTDQNKVEHFLAQAAHETAGPPGEWDEFYSLEEFLDYDTAEEIANTFSSSFGDEGQPDPADYVNDEEKLANYIYAGLLGNGDEESGDGYKYRGRGLFQLTGKNNYQEFSTHYEENHNPDAENQDFVEIPGSSQLFCVKPSSVRLQS